jgi:RNA polymerase sigma-70 factor (ECF subfamily)
MEGMDHKLSRSSTVDTDVTHWVERFGDYLYRYALSRIHDPLKAEDLVQETFLAALKAHHKFEGRASRQAWLMGILKHKIVDQIRKEIREHPSGDIEYLADTIDHQFNGKGHWKVKPNRWITDPRDAYEQKEFMGVFYACLANLPPRLAHVFTLREIEGNSTREICKLLNITATNTWVMLYRARMALRGCIESDWIAPPTAKEA